MIKIISKAISLVKEIQKETGVIDTTVTIEDILRAISVIETIRRNKVLDEQWEAFFDRTDKAIKELQDRIIGLETYRESDRTQFNQLWKKHKGLSTEMHSRVLGLAHRVDELEGGMLELDGITDQVLDLKEKIG